MTTVAARGCLGRFRVQIAALAKKFRVYFQEVDRDDESEDYLVDHSIVAYLMSPEGGESTKRCSVGQLVETRSGTLCRVSRLLHPDVDRWRSGRSHGLDHCEARKAASSGEALAKYVHWHHGSRSGFHCTMQEKEKFWMPVVGAGSVAEAIGATHTHYLQDGSSIMAARGVGGLKKNLQLRRMLVLVP